MRDIMNTFQSEILDIIDNSEGTCFLVKASLKDYLESLPDTYDEFDIQRSIVKNNYLDRLFETVFEKKHIPLIVLLGKVLKRDKDFVSFKEIKILDGLQRTYRLKAIFNYIQLIESNPEIISLTSLELRKFLRNNFSEKIDSGVFNSILERKKNDPSLDLLSFLDNKTQWFEVWTELDVNDQIEKMLILNAGQKPVSIRHQIELLFLNIYDALMQDFPGIVLYRDKDKIPASLAKEREPGTYVFSSVIAAYLSFYEASPVSISQSLVSDLQLSGEKEILREMKISKELIYEVVASLIEIDKCLEKHHGLSGVTWLSREANVSGMFGAFGLALINSKFNSLSEIVNHLKKHMKDFSIAGQDSLRTTVNMSKVNVGVYHRKIVSDYVYKFLTSSNPKSVKPE